MGRRLNSTKGGRYMNPADQARKAARKKELKKNKKQRGIVRQAVLKSKDPDDIIMQMQKLDQMEFDPNNPCPLPQRVVQEKRQKLRETYLRVLGMYKREEEHTKVNELKRKVQEYDLLKSQMEQNYIAVKFAKEANPAEIPLPDGAATPGAAMTPQVPQLSSAAGTSIPFPAHMILPDFHVSVTNLSEPIHGILRKKKKSEHPPGPPIGFPPEFSDSEDEDDEESSDREEQEVSNERPTRVRFEGVDEEAAEKDTRSKFKTLAKKLAAGEKVSDEGEEREADRVGETVGPSVSSLPPNLRPPAPVGNPLFPPGARLMRPPPPPPGMPPRLLMAGRMPPPIPPSGLAPGMRLRTNIGPQIPTVPPPSSAAVIQAAPTITKRTGPVIEAKPQLRNMQQEVTRLVPTALKVKREGTQKKVKPQTFTGSASASGSHSGPGGPGQSKDSAYDEFMSEIAALL